jgi:hypothetical protein
MPAASPKLTPFALAAPVEFTAPLAVEVGDAVTDPETDPVRVALPPVEAAAVGRLEMVTPASAQRAATADVSSGYLVSNCPIFLTRQGEEIGMIWRRGRRTGDVVSRALGRHAGGDALGDLVLAGCALAGGVCEGAAGKRDGGGETGELEVRVSGWLRVGLRFCAPRVLWVQ